jgi:hypothetical protein
VFQGLDEALDLSIVVGVARPRHRPAESRLRQALTVNSSPVGPDAGEPKKVQSAPSSKKGGRVETARYRQREILDSSQPTSPDSAMEETGRSPRARARVL